MGLKGISRVLFDGGKGFVADDVLHLAGIFGSGFFVHAQVNQKLGQQGVLFVDVFRHYVQRFPSVCAPPRLAPDLPPFEPAREGL